MLYCIAQDRLPELQTRIRARQFGEPPPARRKSVLPPPARKLLAETGRPTAGGGAVPGGVAVLQLCGLLEWNPSYCLFGDCTDLSLFAQEFKAAVDDSRVTQIILWVDSPGGCVLGVAETAKQIFEARGKKPITAFVSGMAASAGYWLAAAASKIVAMPSAEIGSIGVYSVLLDYVDADKRAGVGVSIFKAPPLKTALTGLEKPPDEAKIAEQGRVDDVYQRFLKAVARYRRKSPSEVEKDFGAGLTIEARQGLRVGAVDELAMPDAFAEGLLAANQERTARRAAKAARRAAWQRQKVALARGSVLKS